jgi:hypothetical protein
VVEVDVDVVEVDDVDVEVVCPGPRVVLVDVDVVDDVDVDVVTVVDVLVDVLDVVVGHDGALEPHGPPLQIPDIGFPSPASKLSTINGVPA